MRTLPVLLALGLVAAAALAPGPSAALGGVAVHGAGSGTYRNATLACPGMPFVIEVVYLPGGQGTLHLEFVGTSSPCPQAGVFSPVGAGVNTSENPPAKVVGLCPGTEATGLHCDVTVGAFRTVVDVGPYAGPGGAMTVSAQGLYRFDGTFTAV